ncbi:PorP/SprF family type IX secretion system membrane protein [Pontibacter sp. MBLB2868]|uniref:PorP/SprF family type IX secretion system membrane protein n=1 Tax=Pontibacter sp. MBLB2868 TaxID=3451555 RepID=UPI003F74EF41
MKKLILALFMILMVCQAKAQSRKQIANFSQYQHYYNPSLTGFNGSVLKTFYRNQWTGFEDAPKTIFASAELDMQQIGNKSRGFNVSNREAKDYQQSLNPKHSLGLAILHDQFGPSRETQLFLSYGAGIRLSEKLNLRWGTALTYNSNKLDGNSLTVDQENDPKYRDVLGHSNAISKVDLNLGLALSSYNFYLGYAMQDVTEGKFITSGDDFLSGLYNRRHVAQAGYRAGISDQLGFALNGIYQYDKQNHGSAEAQVKAIYNNTFWVGGGYRIDQAYNMAAGIRLDQLSFGYTYESPVQESQTIRKATNELTISYNLISFKKAKQNKQGMIW